VFSSPEFQIFNGTLHNLWIILKLTKTGITSSADTISIFSAFMTVIPD